MLFGKRRKAIGIISTINNKLHDNYLNNDKFNVKLHQLIYQGRKCLCSLESYVNAGPAVICLSCCGHPAIKFVYVFVIYVCALLCMCVCCVQYVVYLMEKQLN